MLAFAAQCASSGLNHNSYGRYRNARLPFIWQRAGPRERGRVAGAVVSEIYSVGPLAAGSGMNITVWSYVDQLNISVLADDRTLRDAHEATESMIRAFTEIASSAGCQDMPTDVCSAMPPVTDHGSAVG